MIRRITFIGMSGCGKTFLSQHLANNYGFFHYSVDWEITTILYPQILQSVIEKIKDQSPFFKSLHEKFAIKTELSLTFDDLSAITSFVIPLDDNGKVAYHKFLHNQNLYKAAELQATKHFFSHARQAINLYKMQGAICDATGSVCEVALEDDEIIRDLKEQTTVVYLQTDETHQEMLVERSKNAIKPILYNENFLIKNLQEYYNTKNITQDFEIDRGFFLWVFPNLLKYRQECYAELVRQTNGIILNAEKFDVENIENLLFKSI